MQGKGHTHTHTHTHTDCGSKARRRDGSMQQLSSMTWVQGTAPDPRHQYVWWRGSWWTWAYGSWYLHTEARLSQEPNRYPHAAGDRSICRGPAVPWRDGFGGTTTVSIRSIPDWMHRLPSRTASGGHCVPVPEAVDRIASRRLHAQANAHTATGTARSCWPCPRPADISSCAGLRLDHRMSGAGRAASGRNRGLCKCPSNTSDASPASNNCRIICVAEVPGGVGAG